MPANLKMTLIPRTVKRHMGYLVIDTREIDEVFVVDIRGRMDAAGNAAQVLRATVGRALLTGKRHFVFNLEDVAYIDSHALSALIESYTTIRKHEGDVRLTGLKGRSMQLMVVTKLVSVFEVFPTVNAALASHPNKRMG
jgi:anti-sigma B factor antagonist